MSHTIKYNQSNETEKQKAAIADCKKWLGVRQFNKVVKILKADAGRSPRELALFGLAMQGIQGYPAEVMVNKYWNSQQELGI